MSSSHWKLSCRIFTELLPAVVCGLLCVSPALAQHDYKVSRNLIRQQKYDQALKVLDQRIAKFPRDSEWVYQQAIALAQSGATSAAMESLKRAIAMEPGVPPARVAADAHDLLLPLAKVPGFRGIVDSQKKVPIQGPMVGSVTATSAGIWLRTAGDARVQVRAVAVHGPQQGRAGGNEFEGEHVLESPVVQTTEESDRTAKLTLTGLKPQQLYQYEVLIDGEPAKLPQTLTFRTTPKKGEPVKFRFAFGGGAGYVTDHEYMWNTIAATRPDALLMLGDNIYSDDPQSRQMQRFCYYRRQSPLPFRKLVSHTSVYSIWDDHDFGTNDCSGGPEIDQPDWKIPVWETFQRNWINPGFGGGREQPGCWYDFHVGDVHFIMLDGRYYRHHKGNTMLGPAQKEWLKKTLRGSDARLTFIASPVPWEYRTKGKSRDTWNGFHDERDEIFNFLTEEKIEGVVLISADRHRSDAWKIERPNAYALYEFNSSRLTNNHVHPEMKEAIFSYNKKQSFGLVDIDTTADDPTVTYSVYSIDGEKIHSLTLHRSQLR